MHTTIRLEYERLSQQLEEMVDGGRCSTELSQYIRIIGKLNYSWCTVLEVKSRVE